ncbi:type II secretion system protein [Sporosarcina sp. NCCP-2331]|nr:prepilin-type N-terminal cleavage/methylation domain-containing protein [Sporosarcina sp. NCCP-2331]GKV65706.1 hypothetical protein NCCP2331_18590 [Sporosarcina sp. NCCP-2331]GLB55830.1 hypothetical protein NCCP2378_16170 [Sporosarcina sp. NCCP-2378]
MKKFLQNKLKNEKGLTLVELLAVIVILGIIAAIAVPAIGNIITNSKVNALKADGQNVLSAGNLYFTENSDASQVTLKELTTAEFITDAGGFPENAENVTVKKVATGNTISGTAVKKGVSVEFTEATNKMIDNAKVKDGGDGVKVNRSGATGETTN